MEGRDTKLDFNSSLVDCSLKQEERTVMSFIEANCLKAVGSSLRTSVLELQSSDSNQMYSDPYGHFGQPSVYNKAYLDSPNGGYEFYTQPTKQWR